MTDLTAFERARLVVQGDRAELRVADGRVTITKEAPTREAPTAVEFGVEQVRGAQLRAPKRGTPGWLHVGVVGGSPAPPGELAAAGDPYTMPVTARSVGAARRLVRLVDGHIRERGMPRDDGPDAGRSTSGVALTSAPPGEPATPEPPPPPPVAPAPAADRTAVDGRPAPAGPAPRASSDQDAAGSTEASELVAELQALADLHASGALSDEEFERAKARVLG